MNSPVSDSDGARVSTAFDLLADPVRRWIWEKGWKTLRDIQERAIPLLMMDERDVIIAAATAGGKTEAAFLPLISRLIGQEKQGQGFDLIYVSPLKALINDQFRRLDDLCERAEIPVHRWHGDISQAAKSRARKNPGGILLITPESLEALFVLRGLEMPALFGALSAVVVDELHALLDSERGIHLRSLMTRLELAAGRPIRRVGLSATLGDMALARAYLRPNAPDTVQLLESRSEGAELKMQLRGYRIAKGRQSGEDEAEQEPSEAGAVRAIGEHLFAALRGKQNLVFAGSRQRVELYADLLRRKTEELGVPEEFFPHHANLSRDHRFHVEERLKAGTLPTTAICTSTLELGIDIGDVQQVVQIGAPFSVASLRQRLGRSGRRPGKPAILRAYVMEREVEPQSGPADLLRLELVRAVAMIDLLVEGWCEPPGHGALHLSTLLHQILSIVAERGGANAGLLFDVLCRKGPFATVDQALFVRLLRAMGEPDAALIEQAPDGTLMLGREGEKLVEHYSFYAVFETPEEYRVVSNGKTLGQIPVLMPLIPDMTIIFSGRRWRILAVQERDKVIEVIPDPTGAPPKFGGEAGLIHDTVVARMYATLMDETPRRYLDNTASELLEEARDAFRHLELHDKRILPLGEKTTMLAPWLGTAKLYSLGLALNLSGAETEAHDGLLIAKVSMSDLRPMLERLAHGGKLTEDDFLGCMTLPGTEKFHRYLPQDLLFADIRASKLDLDAVPRIVADMLDVNRNHPTRSPFANPLRSSAST